MNLLIVEPASGGHHLSAYVRHLVREALARGWRPCLVTTAETRRHPACEELEREFGSHLKTITGPPLALSPKSGQLGLLRRQFQFFAWSRQVIERARREFPADVVLLMSFDALDRVVALRGSPAGGLPFASICIAVRYHWPRFGLAPRRRRDALDRWLFERAVRCRDLKSLFVIDDTYAEYAAGTAGAIADKVAWIPDPGEVELLADRREARNALGIDADTFVVLAYGGIGPGKGVEQLLRAVAGAVHRGEKMLALLAGQCSSQIEPLLASDMAARLRSRGGLLVQDKFHSPREEGIVFGAADAVWVAYSPAFLKRSAVMCQAASAGRPVIARNSGLIGRCVAQNAIGATIDASNEIEVTNLLVEMARKPEQMLEWARNARRFAESYTGASFGRTICETLRSRVKQGDA